MVLFEKNMPGGPPHTSVQHERRGNDGEAIRYIRRLIYRLGFRPKPRTIFYSPSAHLKYVVQPEFVKYLRTLRSDLRTIDKSTIDPTAGEYHGATWDEVVEALHELEGGKDDSGKGSA